MTIVRALVLLGSLITTAALGVAPASATTTDDCQVLLTDLRSATVTAAPSFTNQRSVEGLVDKLDAAAGKLVTGDEAGALAKVGDYRDSLGALAAAPKPKVDPAVAEQLLGQSAGVAGCLTAVGT